MPAVQQCSTWTTPLYEATRLPRAALSGQVPSIVTCFRMYDQQTDLTASLLFWRFFVPASARGVVLFFTVFRGLRAVWAGMSQFRQHAEASAERAKPPHTRAKFGKLSGLFRSGSLRQLGRPYRPRSSGESMNMKSLSLVFAFLLSSSLAFGQNCDCVVGQAPVINSGCYVCLYTTTTPDGLEVITGCCSNSPSCDCDSQTPGAVPDPFCTSPFCGPVKTLSAESCDATIVFKLRGACGECCPLPVYATGATRCEAIEKAKYLMCAVAKQHCMEVVYYRLTTGTVGGPVCSCCEWTKPKERFPILKRLFGRK